MTSPRVASRAESPDGANGGVTHLQQCRMKKKSGAQTQGPTIRTNRWLQNHDLDIHTVRTVMLFALYMRMKLRVHFYV